ncbi:hypothetical protein ACIQNU_04090 [Streptomyces sp. NPDC091292]|uniref:hypothetical protein n=1 Tax=Streptomyces sp. NPDC091292 TaxID=3365991 RepID=UPI00380F4D11
MTRFNHLGADEAQAIRDASARLAEIDNLRTTSSLREVLLDLSCALASLAGPVGVLTDEWIAERGGVDVPPAEELPDTDVLVALAANLRHLADNT